jgi:hypothetical protein
VSSTEIGALKFAKIGEKTLTYERHCREAASYLFSFECLRNRRLYIVLYLYQLCLIHSKYLTCNLVDEGTLLLERWVACGLPEAMRHNHNYLPASIRLRLTLLLNPSLHNLSLVSYRRLSIMVRPFHSFSGALLVGAAVTAVMVLYLPDHEARVGGLKTNKWATNSVGLKGLKDHAESLKITTVEEEKNRAVQKVASNTKWWELNCGHHHAGQADVDHSGEYEKDIASLPKGSSSLLRAGNDTDHCPPLSHLIGDLCSDIIGDVQFLLDFAIIGHPKPATGPPMDWIANHNQVQMCRREIRSLKNGRPAELVKRLCDLPAGGQFKRGYEAPRDAALACPLHALGNCWPKAGLIVGHSHPVRWFESFYNYKTREGVAVMPPAHAMIGSELPEEVLFHVHLATCCTRSSFQRTPRSCWVEREPRKKWTVHQTRCQTRCFCMT